MTRIPPEESEGQCRWMEIRRRREGFFYMPLGGESGRRSMTLDIEYTEITKKSRMHRKTYEINFIQNSVSSDFLSGFRVLEVFQCIAWGRKKGRG
jgi:hypothetical protein